MKRGVRKFPCGAIDVQSKQLYDFATLFAKTAKWVQFEVDWKRLVLLFTPCDEAEMHQGKECEFALQPVLRPPFCFLAMYVTPATMYRYAIQEKMPAKTKTVCSSSVVASFAASYTLNTYTRLWIADDTELLMEYICCPEPPSSSMPETRVEYWVGHQIMQRNEALLQPEVLSSCLVPETVHST